MEALTKTTETIVQEVENDVVESIVAPLSTITNISGRVVGGVDSTGGDEIPSAGIESDLFLKSLSKTILLVAFEIGPDDPVGAYKSSVPILTRMMSTKSQMKEVLKMWRYFRADMEVTIQVNASVGLSGGFVAFFMPPGFQRNNAKWSKATIFNWPHVIFNYGSMTTATLKVPFISHTTYWEHGLPGPDQPNLGFMVLAKMSRRSEMVNYVDVTVMATFKNMTMTCPLLVFQTPERAPPNVNEKSHYTKFKYTHKKMIVTESDGVANLSNAATTGLNISSALAGERIYYTRNTVGGMKPIHDLLEVARIPSWPTDNDFKNPAGHYFTWHYSSTRMTTLFNYSYKFKNLGNLGYMAEGFQGYSGTVNLHLTAFASNLHRGRLMIAVLQNTTGSPTGDLESFPRIQYAVLDLAAKNELVIPMPFMYKSWMMPLNDNAPNHANFRVFVTVLNRLGSSAAAAQEVTVLVRFSAGKDFKFYFLDEPDITVQAPTSWGSEMDLADPIVDETDAQIEACHMTTDNVDTTQEEQEQGVQPYTLGAKLKVEKISPVSYTSLRLIFGRAWLQSEHQYPAKTNQIHVPLYIPKTTHGYLMHFFSYFAGELNVTITNDSDNVIVVCHAYSTLATKLESAGSLAVPARKIITFTAPFYSLFPVRTLANENEPVFGHLYVNCGYLEGSFKVFLSLKNPNFFVPHPNHIRATARDVVLNPELYQPNIHDALNAVLDAEDEEAPYRRKPPGPAPIVDFLKEEADRRGWRSANLALCGDVEENPGPKMSMCYKHRGLYKHYGMTDGMNVIHLNTEDILWSAITGKAKVICSPLDGSWVVLDREAQVCQDLVGMEMEFSIDENCETLVTKFIRDVGLTQGETLKAMLLIFSASMASTLVDQDPTSTFSTIVANVMTYSQNKVLVRVLKFILRLVLYAILFSHAPCLTTGGAVAGLILLDISAAREGLTEPWVDGFIRSAIKGDVGGLIEAVAEGLEDDEEKLKAVPDSISAAKDLVDHSPFDEFNKATLSFKNIEWWIKTIESIINMVKEKISPSDKTKFLKAVKTHETHLASLFTTAQALRDLTRKPGYRSTREVMDKIKYVKDLATHWHLGFQKFCPTAPLAGLVAASVKLMSTIEETPMNPCRVTRQEPLGLFISGAAGQGKSFLATRIMKGVMDKMGWPRDSVYFHPTGSKFMDGYQNQKVHIFDDFGQTIEEEDFNLICQMISTVQFPVPMARLEDKGTWYDSLLVIATSNRTDFSSTKLYSKAALERRFPFQIFAKADPRFTYQGRLLVSKFMEEVKAGTAWVDENGRPILVDQVVDAICLELMNRASTSTIWADFIDQADNPFETWMARMVVLAAEGEEALFGEVTLVTPSELYKSKVKVGLEKIDHLLRTYGHWMIFVTTLGTIAAGLVWYCSKKKELSKMEEEIYEGQPTAKPKKTLFTPVPVKNQSPMDEFDHLTRYLVRLVADRVQVFGLAIGGDKVLTYGHSKDILFNASEVYLVYKEHKILLTKPTFQEIMVNDVKTDLAIVKTGVGLTLADGTKQTTSHLTNEGVLIWNTKSGFHIQHVTHITPIGRCTTLNGTEVHDALQYRAQTSPGSCGGMLCCKDNGMWKFVAMHMAGNGFVGRAVRLPPLDQGLILPIPKLDLPPAHLSNKTKLVESPLHGIVEVEKGPAVLSARDPRTMENPMVNIVNKNVGNVFKPKDPERFKRACLEVSSRLVRVVGVHEPSTFEDALFNLDRPVDTSTSPGFKYTMQGFTKKKLIDYDQKTFHPKLEEDVKKMWSDLDEFKCDTFFTTAFKDELRSLEKIKNANTRVIEASNLDYTIAFRMLFGKQLDILCKLPKDLTGICVGICPYKDWTALIASLYENNYDFDYKAFDGSLSDHLMVAALEIMAQTSTEPSKLMVLGMATVYSTHHGPFDYTLIGSNPSGTPFTTVMNCLANLIVVEYHMQQLEMNYLAYTYGDDLILSVEKEICVESFKDVLKEEFGMTITPGDKGAIFINKKPFEVQFLKRLPVHWTANTIVGALDLKSMMQNIMWCRGAGAFEQQIVSFQLELVLHGKEVYEDVKMLFMGRGVYLEPFEVSKMKMNQIIFD